ncbi:hypothetical protein C2R22_24235 (plasmid) [Salinigranum rubrum]|uniref:EamA domain-containing protein n=1 Tax=Salinigranum rubrum TaxID=755307 RepID=A0A2I8VRU3_9EURY|nr:hypothetical protein [Salinigranum rubrum]AUV84641.1 hypothetical protein C2R22_24235 [Salinigranum rubrum]
MLFALLIGTASIFLRRGLEHGSFAVLPGFFLAISSPIFLLLTAVTTGFVNTPVLGIAYAGIGAVIGSIVCRSLYFLGIAHLGPGKPLLINAVSPLFRALFA